MEKDYKGDVERDIEKFKQTGALPKDYDVHISRSGDSDKYSQYWNYVGRNLGGNEPFFNSGEIPVEDDGPYTDHVEAFKNWLTTKFPNMSYDDKELFRLAFELQMDVTKIAEYLRVRPVTVYKRLDKLRKAIAADIGISM